ncbi:unnamed protein product [Protopolystoma xenopodis]|uniref:Gamma-tubulin complex component n=1 Tax=Protopolystoma xenopodis TaxID=117903 RepID=A0A3S4ZGW0_9PLAT|nr:unnamed protein product [Protopolystoma xenopodis]
MLHELLFALNGFPGDIFVCEEVKDFNDERIASHFIMRPIADDLPYVNPAELSLMSQLLNLGADFHSINRFIQKHLSPGYSLYLTATANGIDDAMTGYRSTLCEIEHELLMDKELGTAHISYRLHNYRTILPIVRRLTQQLEKCCSESKGSGDQLKPSIRVLESVISIYLPGLSCLSTLKCILSYGLRVFYRQLSSWVLQGILSDPFGEFFIEKFIPSNLLENNENVLTAKGDKEAFDEFPEVVDPLPEFQLVPAKLPLFIPPLMTSQILFIGETIFFRSCDYSRSSKQAPLVKELDVRYADRFRALESPLISRPKSVQNEGANEEHPLDDKCLFDITPVQNLISEIRMFVSKSVWTSYIEEYQLINKLQLAKDVFLLGRGELFLAFLDNLRSPAHMSGVSIGSGDITILDVPPPKDIAEARALAYDINRAFLMAARSIELDDEELGRQFRFTLSTSPYNDTVIKNDSLDSKSAPTAWDCLRLHYRVPSGKNASHFANRVFSIDARAAYARLFSFLITVRRTQAELHRHWAGQTFVWRRHRELEANLVDRGSSKKGVLIQVDEPIDMNPLVARESNMSRRMLIRNHMIFLLDSIQYHLQVRLIFLVHYLVFHYNYYK